MAPVFYAVSDVYRAICVLRRRVFLVKYHGPPCRPADDREMRASKKCSLYCNDDSDPISWMMRQEPHVDPDHSQILKRSVAGRAGIR